jgi:hypothetical protein
VTLEYWEDKQAGERQALCAWTIVLTVAARMSVRLVGHAQPILVAGVHHKNGAVGSCGAMAMALASRNVKAPPNRARLVITPAIFGR